VPGEEHEWMIILDMAHEAIAQIEKKETALKIW